jgi:hypothetical protein
MTLDSYDDPVVLDERLKKDSPRAWCRNEAVELADLLTTHVRLANESGTDVKRVIRLLENVRRATLDATMEDTNHG